MVQRINGFESGRDQFIQKLQAAGITQEEIQTARTEGTDAFNQLLASHGIQAPPPPPKNDEQDEFMQKLQAAGITKEEFQTAFAQGPQAVMKLLKSHGVQLSNSDESELGIDMVKQCQKPVNTEMTSLIQQLQAAGITREQFEAARSNESLNELFKKYGIEF